MPKQIEQKIELKKITIPVAKKFSTIYKNESMAYDHDFYNQHYYSNLYHTSYFLSNNFLYIQYAIKNTFIFAPPFCSNNSLIKYIDNIKKYYKDFSVTLFEEQYQYLKNKKYKFTKEYEDVDYEDYIYLSSDLANFDGAKYQDKRNLFNQFISNYKYEFVKYEEKYLDCVKKFLVDWYANKDNVDKDVTFDILSTYKKSGVVIYLLLVNDQVIGLSMVKTNKNCTTIYVEKGDTNYKGVYAAIVKLTAQCISKKCKYINREDDLGIPGLKKSKESYNPIYKIKKWYVSIGSSKST